MNTQLEPIVVNPRAVRAYDQGFAAGRGLVLRETDNPYPHGTHEWRNWRWGWVDGVPEIAPKHLTKWRAA